MPALDLATQEIGSGPTVVILHGLLGSKRNWQGIAKALAENFHVVAADLRNHAESPWHADMAYDAMAADVAALIQGMGTGPVSVIGHSMGGKTAMMLALDHAHLVERLVVVDIAPTPSPGHAEGFVEALAAVDLGRFQARREVDAHLASDVPDAGIRAFLLQNLDTSGARLAWKPNLSAIMAELDTIVDFPDVPMGRTYDGPTQFIAGANSDYLQPGHHAAARALFPNAEFEVIADAGHWVHAEQPAAFIESVLPFLKGDG